MSVSKPSWRRLGHTLARRLRFTPTRVVQGRVQRVVGAVIEATLTAPAVGELCLLADSAGPTGLVAEVIGFGEQRALLTPLGAVTGVRAGMAVFPTGRRHHIGVGPGLLGRVLDGLGQPLDTAHKGPLITTRQVPVLAPPPDPLKRAVIHQPLPLGIRAIDGVLTCGEGQRLGVFAAAGGGKSTLLAMLTRGAQVDVTVLALIGERGREVREFIEHDLGPAGMARAVVVCATSDKSSMERLKAAHVATAIAEYFRDAGQRVLLLMDSVTRFARAQREIGLAAGEPPTRRGFPPSVFTALPALLERTGLSDKGSITALYTVLVEGDDLNEPVADETRSILDGHIVLSRELAAAGHYPAIDVLASASRVMKAVTEADHLAAAGRLRALLAKYADIEMLVQLGEYQAGHDAEADHALAAIDAIRAFLRQDFGTVTPFAETLQRLAAVTA